MLTVCCVKWGKKYSAEYVNILYDSVQRNLNYDFRGRFVCFTDDPTGLAEGIQSLPLPPDLEGWWNKLYLFSPDAFPKGERVLYFDLDTVITGPLDAIAAYKGFFAMLRDAYRPDGRQSSVMAWEAGTLDQIWLDWLDEGKPQLKGGDQEWIEWLLLKSDIWQEEFPGKFKSYKVDARNEIPKGCSVVFFHGEPRPHEVKDGWVPHVWKVGGGSGVEFIVQANVSDEVLRENVKWTKEHCHTWLKKEKGFQGKALIVAGGPSLEGDLFRIKGMQLAGGKVFVCGNAGAYLLKHDIKPDAQVLLDARPANADFVLDLDIPIYIASQCAAETWRAALGWYPKSGWRKPIGFHAAQTSYADLTGDEVNVGGGTTVGLKTIALTYLLGYRTLHLFGFDSCYSGNQHHAYPQVLNDGERRVEARVGEEVFHCAPWMVTQAEEFKELAPALVSMGCQLVIHGSGLIPTIASKLEVPPTPPDIRASEILKRLNGSSQPKGAEVGVFAGALSIRLLEHPSLELYMVDSWTVEHSKTYYESGDFHASLTQGEQDSLCDGTKIAVAFAGERAKVLRMDSLKAAETIEDGSLDFVFLDADHTYEAVKADIEAWWPKVKAGGFLSGHDYDDPQYPLWGVKKAVTERFGSVDLGENNTWFQRKDYEH